MDPIERLAEFDKILRAFDLAVEPPAPADRDYDFADRLSKDGQEACVSAKPLTKRVEKGLADGAGPS